MLTKPMTPWRTLSHRLQSIRSMRQALGVCSQDLSQAPLDQSKFVAQASTHEFQAVRSVLFRQAGEHWNMSVHEAKRRATTGS